MVKEMKKLLFVSGLVLLMASCSQYGHYGRVDQIDSSVPAPAPVMIKSVRNIPGGAVIKVTIPDDDNLKGVIAMYERGGEEVNTKISRYVDSLVVEGFADTQIHTIKVASFNVNEVQSEPVDVDIFPLEPPIVTVRPTLIPTFGGVKVLIEGNEAKADLAVCLLICKNLEDEGKPVSDMRWEEVTTMFTASNDIKLTRRNLQPEEALFGVYVRDHWGNMTDTTVTKLTPIEETKLDKSKFAGAQTYDNCFTVNETNYPLKGLWDDSGASSAGHFFASGTGPMPAWVTIDLGVRAQISRIATLPRIDYVIWSGAHPRDFEFWGSLELGEESGSQEHEFSDNWFCLGRFTQFKPSGYLADGTVGEVTVEDRTYFNDGNDFELDPVEFPKCNDEIRYLRIVFIDTFSTFEMKAKDGTVQFGEVTPYGLVLENYR